MYKDPRVSLLLNYVSVPPFLSCQTRLIAIGSLPPHILPSTSFYLKDHAHSWQARTSSPCISSTCKVGQQVSLPWEGLCTKLLPLQVARVIEANFATYSCPRCCTKPPLTFMRHACVLLPASCMIDV